MQQLVKQIPYTNIADTEIQCTIQPLNEGHEMNVRKKAKGTLPEIVREAVQIIKRLYKIFPEGLFTAKISSYGLKEVLIINLDHNVIYNEDYVEQAKLDNFLVITETPGANKFYFAQAETRDGENEYLQFTVIEAPDLDSATEAAEKKLSYSYCPPDCGGRTPDDADVNNCDWHSGEYRITELKRAEEITREEYEILRRFI